MATIVKSETLETENNKNVVTINFSKDKNSKSYKCEVCGTSFFSKKSITDHKKSAHMKNQKEVRELLAKNNSSRSYKCDICEKSFFKKGDLKRHIEWHKEKTHECDICHKMFPSIGTVKHHRNRIHFPKILICRWNCGQTFNDHGPRIKHEKIKHYENKPLERICDICGKPCTTEVALGNHKKTHLNPSERANEHKCSICTEIFQSTHKLSHHRKLVHDLAKFKCSKCNKIFVKEQNLELHMENHESSKKIKNQNLHSCHQCFSDQKYSIVALRKHLQSKHSAIFKCKEYGCQKSFWHEDRYQRHVKKHQESKCHLCYLVLVNPMNARIHLIGVHKLTIEELTKLGKYDPNNYRIRKKNEVSWLNR